MGYLPQFIAGDATTLGKSLVTATPTSDAARDLLGLGEGDSPQFSRLGVGTEVSGPRALEVDGGDLAVNNGHSLQLRSTNNTYSGTIAKNAYNALISLSHNGTTELESQIIRLSLLSPNRSIDIANYDGHAILRPRTSQFSINVGVSGSFGFNSIGSNANTYIGNAISQNIRSSGNIGIRFHTKLLNENSAKVFISPEGYLGIGYSSPVSPLDVAGNATFRNGTDPTQLHLYKTYTSTTNFERLQFDATGDAYRIGSAVGSAGGGHRDILIGRWTPDGNWGEQFGVPYGLKLDTDNRLTLSGAIGGEGVGLTVDNLHTGGQPAYIRLRGRVGSGLVRDWTIEKTAANIYRLNIYPQSANPLLTCWVHYGTPNDSRLGIGTIDPLTRMHVVGDVTLEGLPTTDPAVADRLWNNGNVLTLSGVASPVFSSVTVGAGTSGAPALRFGAGADGIWRNQSGTLRVSTAGTQRVIVNASGFMLTGIPLRLDAQSTGAPAYLYNGGSNTIEQRNDTAGQIFRLHKTYTSNSNREYLQFDATADAYRIGSAVGSTGGTQRVLELGRWLGDGSFAHTASILADGIEVSSRTSNLRTKLTETALLFARASDGNLANRITTDDTGTDIDIRARSSTHIVAWDGGYGVSVSGSGKVRLGLNMNRTIAGSDSVRIEGSTRFTGSSIIFQSIPTTDPGVAGRLWNDNGTLKISAG